MSGWRYLNKINKAKGKVAAQEFFSYMKSTQAKKIIKAAGYDVLE